MELKEIVKKIRSYQDETGITPEELRYDLIENGILKECESSDILFSVSRGDTEYIELLCELIPELENQKEGFREGRGRGYEKLLESLRKWLESRGVLVDKVNELEKEEVCEEEKGDLTSYIKELNKRGFKIVSDADKIGSAKGFFTACLKLFEKTYEPIDMLELGYKDTALYNHSSLLEELGINPKKADLWDKKVFTKHEDLAFRLFIKESESAYQFVLKLPLGVSTFELETNGGETVKTLKGLPMLIGGKCAYLNTPKVSNIQSSFGIESEYDFIDFIIVKDFKGFKEENWLLRDYIKQARGVKDTKFKDIAEREGLPLGKRLTVGLYPGGLVSREFICTSDVSSSIMCGGAGSGKTAMNDNIVVQSLAYEGEGGDGGVVLIDFKEEWIPSWRGKFKERGIPFYGFDGEKLKDDLQMEVTNKKGEKSIVDVPFEVPMYLAGAIYLEGIYNYIQEILKKSGACENILDFNKRGEGYKSLRKLPRITIVLDEINSMYDYISKNAYHKQIFKTGLIRAKLTRTSGFLWFLGGQDVSDTIIPKAEKGSYRFRITGSLERTRYEYYGVKVNPAIDAYAKKHGTTDVPDPIMRQGMFYTGVVGQSMVTKCMYLPANERGEVLDDLQIGFEGMKQLHELTKLALEEGVFDRANGCVGSKNNIVYGALKKLGVITEKEFRYYTDRLFGEGVSSEGEEAVDLEEFNNVGESYGGVREENKRVNRKGEEFKLNSQGCGVEGVLALDLAKRDIESNVKELIEKEREDLKERHKEEYEEVERGNKEEIVKLKEEGKLVLLDARRRGISKEEQAELLKEIGEGIKEKELECKETIKALKTRQEKEELELGKEQLGLLKELRLKQERLEKESNEDKKELLRAIGEIKGEVQGLRGYVEGVKGNIENVLKDKGREINFEDRYGGREVSGLSEKEKELYDGSTYKSANSYEGKLYGKELDLKGYNPFDRKNRDTVFGTIDGFNYMSKQIEKEIREAFYGLERIKTLHISDSGLFINEIAFRPRIGKEVIETMPIDIREEVRRGNILEFFNFGLINKMPNLNTLVIDDVRLAETRVRMEVGLKKRDSWNRLYKKLRSLMHLEIGGSRITTEEEARMYEERGAGAGYKLQERLREVYGVDSDILDRVKSPIKKAMRSKPVTIVTGAMGGVIGTKAVLGIASMMGAWGVVFAGLTGYGAYRTYIKKK